MKFKEFFKLNNWKRMVILGTTLVATVVAVVLGSIFYVSKDVKKSIEYAGGEEYVMEITHTTDQIGAEVAQSIYERIDGLGVAGAQVESGHSNGHNTVRVRYPGLKTKAERDRMHDLIKDKPHLSFTDVFGNALFDKDGKFNRELLKPHTGLVPGLQNYKESKVPLDSGGTKAIFSQDGKHKVELKLKDNNAAGEWKAATGYIASLKGPGNNSIVAWLDVSEMMKVLNPAYTSKTNPFLAAYVNNDPKGILRKSVLDTSKYLLSVASVKSQMTGRTFVLEGNFNQQETKDLARKLNFGSASYDLKDLSHRHIEATYGKSAFKKAVIAGIIVFAVIAIFLMVNYGLLGALSTISIALYIFMTLMMFTVMRGEYSPATIAAIIIGVGMSVDANIITFERLKNQLYDGASVKKANKMANRQSLSAIFDANITTLIIAFVLFYFGTRDIIGMSITLILSIFFTLLVMLVFTRIMASLMLNTGYFDKRKKLLGLRPKIDKQIQNTLDKPDYVKKSGLFVMISAWIIITAIITFVMISAIQGSFLHGMNFSKEFTGGSDIKITLDSGGNFSAAQISNIDAKLAAVGVLGDTTHSATSIMVDTTKSINMDELTKSIEGISSNNHILTDSNYISNESAKKIVRDALIAISIAIGLIIVYTLIRFKWTYSFAAIIALVHDGLMVVAAFVLIRVEMSPIFIAGILSILGYSINDTIVTFDRVRERMAAHVGPLDAKNIKAIGNQAVKDTIKRSILTSLTTIMAIVVLMAFGNATKLSFNLAMLVGLLAGTYSSIFIATYLWSKMEIRRQKGIQKREKNGFWKTKGIEEQTFSGINDFKA